MTKQIAKWGLCLLIVFLVILFLPFLLLLFRSTFYSKTLIKPSDFLNFVAIMSTGLLSVSISIIALIISKRADKRDRSNNQIKINTTKKIISFHVERSCQAFFFISEKQKASCDIETPTDFEYHIEFLVANKKISKDDSDLIKSINAHTVKLACAHTQEELFANADIACEHFIDQDSKNKKIYRKAENVETVMKKLQVEEYA